MKARQGKRMGTLGVILRESKLFCFYKMRTTLRRRRWRHSGAISQCPGSAVRHGSLHQNAVRLGSLHQGAVCHDHLHQGLLPPSSSSLGTIHEGRPHLEEGRRSSKADLIRRFHGFITVDHHQMWTRGEEVKDPKKFWDVPYVWPLMPQKTYG